MNNEFVTYKIAKALDELGFDLPCLAWFYEDYTGKAQLHLNPNESTDDSDNELCGAPLWQQCEAWLREKHKIYYAVIPWKDMTGSSGYEAKIYSHKRLITTIPIVEIEPNVMEIPTFEQAREAAILKSIELLKG